MDVGLVPGNYHDYTDDEVAIQREFEIGDSLDANFKDDDFPANARSLYFDPLNPPKGSIPNENIKWFSICQGDVVNCDNPVFYCADADSSVISQGALGDGYFVNGLRLLSCQPSFLNRLLVSDKFAAQGLYTIKLYKAGKWRYIHIDDYIPCRPSGRVNFARNFNPNEVFAMLLEKAYAKLHGCYEAVPFGLAEKVLAELTPSAGVQTLRIERLPLTKVCDTIWDSIEQGIANGCLIGCSRVQEHAYSENPSKRKGISLGHMYQIVDACVTSAEPTADLDAITVGMVCVRNLQRNAGRFTGRWSYGHKLWAQYPEIAFDLRHRTREIQHKRGLGGSSNEETEEAAAAEAAAKRSSRKLYPDDNYDEDDEPDDLDITYIENDQTVKIVQPDADDLHWVQIEDFVEIFNRVYVLTDLTMRTEGTIKCYSSKWIPGDFIGGSGGPPLLIHTHARNDGEEEETAAATDEDHNSNAEEEQQVAARKADEQNGGDDNIERGEIAAPLVVERYAAVNTDFTDNPMYPFSVSEPTTVVISLYQKDRRWNVGRLGENPRDVLVSSFATRGDRLQACMEYAVGIAFVVVRLSGLKHRLTEFKLKKIVDSSGGLVFSGAVSNTLHLQPGRYAVIPYTHRQLDRTSEYLLHTQYLSNAVEFEIVDLLEQRLIDDMPSDDEDEGMEPDDNDLLHLNQDTDEISIMSYEKVTLAGEISDDDNEDGSGDKRRPRGGAMVADSAEVEELQIGTGDDDDDTAANMKTVDDASGTGLLGPTGLFSIVPPPRVLLYHPWEYIDDVEERGLQHMYGEVGDVMHYVKNLRNEVRKLYGTIRTLSVTDGTAAYQQQQQQAYHNSDSSKVASALANRNKR